MNMVNVKKTGSQILITFKSKSFLQNQVRSMVGSLKYLSSGKWSLREFNKAFKSKKDLTIARLRQRGLFLKNIKY